MMDVASSKKGAKKWLFRGRSTEIIEKCCLGEVKVLQLRCILPDSFTIILDVIKLGPLRFSFMMKTRLQRKFASWGITCCVLCYVKCYRFHVKTNLKLINAVSAPTLSHPKSIAIWPAAAQLCHSAALRHDRQPGFHEAHPQLSIDCESDQEIRHDRDRDC